MLFVALWSVGCVADAPSPEPVSEPIPETPVAVAPPAPAVDVASAEPRRIGADAPTGSPAASTVKVLYTSRGDGDIEPCGCPRQPAGGLARRRTVIEAERAGAPALVVDAGDGLAKLVTGRPELSGQEVTKAGLIVDAWIDAGLDAVAIGAADWALGRAWIDAQVARGYPALAANLVCGAGERPYPAAHVFERGGRRIAVIGLTAGVVDGCVVTDPVEALRESVASLASHEPDVTLALWPARGDEAWFAARDGLGVDFIVEATGRFPGDDAPLHEASTWILAAGVQTKSVGVLTLDFARSAGRAPFYPRTFGDLLDGREARAKLQRDRAEKQIANAKDERERRLYTTQVQSYTDQLARLDAERARWAAGGHHVLSARLTLLDEAIADHPATATRVAETKASFSELPDASGAEILARPMRAPENSAYAGTVACAGCHPAAYQQWRQTGHARAIAALIRVDRHADDACWTCHVTGAEPAAAAGHPVEIQRVADIGGLLNVQCEACHGPGRAHAADPEGARLVRAPAQAVCVGCHDGVRDEGRFDFATYLPRVSHAETSAE